jgi:glucokinase
MLLAGDVGGTKTRLAIFSAESGPRAPLAVATRPSQRDGSLEESVKAFLRGGEWPVERACFAVAGPVVGGRATVTNLPWALDEAGLAERLGLRSVRLVNDLQALAHGVPLLVDRDLHTLSVGEAVPTSNLAVIAPGTGLGEAFLTWDGAAYRAHASEGGHADFAPTSPTEAALLTYLWERFEHVSYERVCSGLGIPNLYAFLKASGRAEEPAWLARELAAAPDPTPPIVAAALDPTRRCALAAAALDLFVAILGAEAGNLALKTLATGGVYLGGGIPPRILPALADGAFLTAFRRKGRFAPLLERVPVQVVTRPDVALLGAARYGLEDPTR